MLPHPKNDSFKRLLLSLAIGLMLTITAHGQAITSVYDIIQNPGAFINENVQVEGLVFQYVPGTSNTVAYYLIRDDNGAELQINTVLDPPETNIKYRVTGVLYNENRNLFISELNRESLAPKILPQVIIESDNKLLYYALAGLGFVLLFSLYLLYVNRSGSMSSEINDVQISLPSSQSASTKPEAMPSLKNDAYDIFVNSSAENTIKVDRDYMTMKALPGRLVVLNGQQAEKTLSLFGATTQEGQVITIGRESPDWRSHLKSGRENAHIRIQDSTKTLSRMQAELIYSDGTMKLRNIGQANPTVVDDAILKVGETIQLNDGSIIQAGNLKMRFEM